VAAFSTCMMGAAAIGAAALGVWCVLPRSEPAQRAAASTAGPREAGSRPASVPVPIDRLKILNAGAVPANPGSQVPFETARDALADASGEETASAASRPGGSRAEPVRRSTPPATYRTVCVRLCDGGYFPISFATTRNHFSEDEAVCQQSCGAPARLYVYRNPGGIPDYMHDLDGNAYTELTTAFLFRSSYDPACTCRPQPWTVAAQHSHREVAQSAGEADVGQEAVEAAAQPLQPAEGAAEETAAAGSGDGAGSAQPAPARAEAAEPRARKRGARAAPARLATALEGRDAAPAPRRREASASRRFDGTDWRITPYQPF
jgi:Protein of unknown function (DUF2865)